MPEIYKTFALFLILKRPLIKPVVLKDHSQVPPFSMPLKLLILHCEARSYCITVSCVPEGMFSYLESFHSDFLRFDMLRIKYNCQNSRM